MMADFQAVMEISGLLRAAQARASSMAGSKYSSEASGAPFADQASPRILHRLHAESLATTEELP